MVGCAFLKTCFKADTKAFTFRQSLLNVTLRLVTSKRVKGKGKIANIKPIFIWHTSSIEDIYLNVIKEQLSLVNNQFARSQNKATSFTNTIIILHRSVTRPP